MSRANCISIVLFSLLLVFLPLSLSAAPKQELDGYIEYRGFSVDDDRRGREYGSFWHLRPKFKGKIGKGKFNITSDFSRRSGYVERSTGSDHDSDLARAYVEFNKGQWDLRAGKQAVHWGSAHIWNPTDPFPEVFIADPWAERQGVIAFRFDRLIDEEKDETLTLVALADDEVGRERRHVVRYSRLFNTTDFSFSVGYDDKMDTRWFGLDLRGEDTVGWWLEAVWREAPAPFDDWYEAVIGIDYSYDVKQGLLLALQYYRNTSDLITPATAGLGVGGSSTTAGRNHMSFTATLTYDEDITPSLTILRNLDDDSMLLIPQVSWKLWGRDELIFGGRLGLNGPGAYDPSGAIDPLGLVPERAYYLWLRRFF